MSTQLHTIQAHRDSATGKIERVEIIDEITAEDPVTGDIIGTGRLVSPRTILNRADAPALFTQLDAVTGNVAERTADKAQAESARRAQAAADKAAKEAEAQKAPVR